MKKSILDIYERINESVATTLVREAEEEGKPIAPHGFEESKVPAINLTLEIKTKVAIQGGKYFRDGMTSTRFGIEYQRDEIRDQVDKQVKEQIIPYLRKQLKLTDKEVKSLEKADAGSWAGIQFINTLRTERTKV